MRLMILMIVVVAMIQPLSAQKIGDVKTRTKSLGDINGDGKPELAIERDTYGASAYFTGVTIKSGRGVLLSILGLSHDTADGYAVVGKQVVVWQGDWQVTPGKWQPHYYNFTWYGWSGAQGKAVTVKEGYTRKAYSYSDAAKAMPKLARNPGAAVMRSQGTTFAAQAGRLASKKFGKRLRSVRGYPSAKDARYYFVKLVGAKGTSFDVEVRFQRNGQARVVSMNEQSF